jgi:superfamily I DNA/RNA helicase
VKGLEFDHVVIAGRFDPKFLEEGESDIKKRMLLYVAATRARKFLFICRKV